MPRRLPVVTARPARSFAPTLPPDRSFYRVRTLYGSPRRHSIPSGGDKPLNRLIDLKRIADDAYAWLSTVARLTIDLYGFMAINSCISARMIGVCTVFAR